ISVSDISFYDPNSSRIDLSKHLNITSELIEEAIETDAHEKYPKRHGVDFYHRYKEDIAYCAAMGYTVLRISIPWSRLFRNGDETEPNASAFQFYDAIFDDLEKHQIEPLVTLAHFEMPIHLVNAYGGWKNREVISMFMDFVHVVFERYHKRVRYWITFNEINEGRFSTFKSTGVVEDRSDHYLQDCYKAINIKFMLSGFDVSSLNDLYPVSYYM